MTTFRFDFGGDDINDEVENRDAMARSSSSSESELLPHTLFSMRDLLLRLPSSISYAMHPVPCSTANDPSRLIKLPRRELHDIRAQSMADDDLSKATSSIPGLSTDDLEPRVYEGGFKTWECSVDLAGYLGRALGSDSLQLDGKQVELIELGAGTALPSSMLLHHFLTHPTVRSCRMILADYNVDVLALATMANMLLTASAAISDTRKLPEDLPGDLEITPLLINRLMDDLFSRGISVLGISGAWARGMADLITEDQNESMATARIRIILASETIYSPSSMRNFVVTLLALLKTPGYPAMALVAAKKIYFGVGGSIDAFNRVLEELGGISEEAWSSAEGIGRCILRVRLK